jgi:1-acyl-sn-glycerol-3-phosphate acyltransferase
MRRQGFDGTKPIGEAELAAIMNPPARVQALAGGLMSAMRKIDPLVDVYQPYVDGLEALPRDGRFLLVANHTQFALAEVLLIPYLVQRELGIRVRPLAERGIAAVRGPMHDVISAYGAVVGHPDTAGELMRNNEPVLVFPGGAREISKFKGEEYQLRWEGRSGFARVAIAHDYPIIPVGLVGGDDVYRSVTTRDSLWGRASSAVSVKLSGRRDAAFPLLRGVGVTPIPRPQRMYLKFAAPIETVKPLDVEAKTWEAAVKQRTQESLESVLAELRGIRAKDPYRSLNPIAWPMAIAPRRPAASSMSDR